jgi:hypothetical protein
MIALVNLCSACKKGLLLQAVSFFLTSLDQLVQVSQHLLMLFLIGVLLSSVTQVIGL